MATNKKTAVGSLSRLREADLLRALMDKIPDHIYVKDSRHRFILANRIVIRNLGATSLDQIRNKTDLDFFPARHARKYIMDEKKVLAGKPIIAKEEFNINQTTQMPQWLLTTKVPLRDRKNRIIGLAGINRDITDRKALENQLFQNNERQWITLQSIGDGVITTDGKGLVTYLNRAAQSMTGWTIRQARGHPIAEVYNVVNEKKKAVSQSLVGRTLKTGRTVARKAYLVLTGRSDREYIIEDTCSPLHDHAGMITGAVTVFHDVTRLRRMTKRISWQASHDALTGIYNRLEFEDRLAYLLRGIKNEKWTHALLYIDLDRFKRVNDTCGHRAGDRLLKSFTALVQKLLRKSDIFARIGGDEFGIILTDCPAAMAEKIARKICSAVKGHAFPWGNRSFRISASIGIAVIGQASRSVSAILSAADRAQYAAKGKGGNRVVAAEKLAHPAR